ncbi:leucine-rich repeat extensin-like protein 3 [Salvia divinorum]|uniref:Leucine-rich repeat extensin-like protein 3 n=1 Tax=Salvia divinorum TaxID=28513 RepID=A0ABD1FK89_SALDI
MDPNSSSLRNRRGLPPLPPLLIPPYNPYAAAPPVDYMPPPSSSFLPQPPPYFMPLLGSPFPPQPPLPPQKPTVTSHPPSSPPPLPPLELRAKILKQIEYYFSDANLIRDDFLKMRMDDHGWVPVQVVADFPLMTRITNDIPLILFTMRGYSQVVEVQGDRLRRRGTWHLWLSFFDRTGKFTRNEGTK